MQLLRKISARTVYGSKADIQALVLADRTSPHFLFRVGGNVTGTRKGSTADANEETEGAATKAKDGGKTMRDWTALLGNFRAQNQRGVVYRSGVCFLPNYVVDAIMGQFTNDVASVDFVFDLYARFDEQSATSYVYEAEMLSEEKDADRITTMMAQTKALPAPGPVKPQEKPLKKAKEETKS